jgi:hypothetical protein
MNDKIRSMIDESLVVLKSLPPDVLKQVRSCFVKIASDVSTVANEYYSIEPSLFNQVDKKDLFKIKEAFLNIGFLIRESVFDRTILEQECYREDTKDKHIYWDQYIENIREETCDFLVECLGMQKQDFGLMD